MSPPLSRAPSPCAFPFSSSESRDSKQRLPGLLPGPERLHEATAELRAFLISAPTDVGHCGKRCPNWRPCPSPAHQLQRAMESRGLLVTDYLIRGTTSLRFWIDRRNAHLETLSDWKQNALESFFLSVCTWFKPGVGGGSGCLTSLILRRIHESGKKKSQA